MGPYYLTALINMLGAVEKVGGSAVKAFEERTIGSGSQPGWAHPGQHAHPRHGPAQL